MGALVHRIVAVGLSAFALEGCGWAASAIGMTSQAALAPVAGVVQTANYGLMTIDHTATTIAASNRSTATSVAQSARTVRTVQTSASQPTAPTVASPSLTKAQKDAIAQGKDAPQPDIQVLPDETLAKLSKDQRGLQKAAQKAALTADIGETIFWDDAGRSGTAMAKDEHKLGAMLCRTFEQTVTIDGTKTEARASACLDTDSHHWQAAF